MAKKSAGTFFCSECGYETSRWLGKCPGCHSWNTLVESRTVTGTGKGRRSAAKGADVPRGRLEDQLSEIVGETALQDLEEVDTAEIRRISSGLPEFDRVLGGGFVPGSLVLVGGDPGIGKSTLLLQATASNGFTGTTLYICGEESPAQVKLRAARLNIPGKQVKLYSEIIFERISATVMKLQPDFIIVDSIQTIYSEELTSAPGSVSQIREVTAGFLRLAKGLTATIVLVGHVTKDGAIAGPRVLEHMVDTVLYFEGEQHNNLRMIRGFKNRFGATNELGIFEMTGSGLLPLENASAALIAGRPQGVTGSAVTACIEGTRPLLLEVQVLLNDTVYGMPQRITQGLDRTRVSMLMAVLEKHIGLQLGQSDAFCNVIGGVRINDPAADLAVAAAIASSSRDIPVRRNTLLIGEIGLTGELRSVAAVGQRVTEAGRLGFEACILPGSCRKQIKDLSRRAELPEIFFADSLGEALDIALG
jgi:DNA repair protein RadA/Sms